MKSNISDTASEALGVFTTYCRKLAFSLFLASLFFSTNKPCNANPSSTTNKPTTVANAAIELHSLIKEAEKGDPLAQYLIGIHYWQEQDFDKGLFWLEKAASNGNVYAQSRLGAEYSLGFYIDKNHEKSTKYYLLAADQGLAHAQITIGDNYKNGENGFPVNYQKAIEYYRLAAEQEATWAQTLIGYMYREGKGVPADQEKSAYWYNKAEETKIENKQKSITEYDSHPLVLYAKKGNHFTEYLVGLHFSWQGESLKKLGDVWLNKSAESGNMYAQYYIGMKCWQNDFLTNGPKDIQKSLKYYHLSAKQGYAPAQYMIGTTHMDGKGVPIDQEQGIHWIELAAANGNATAQTTLALNYYSGEDRFFDKETKAWSKRSFPKNLKKSFKYYRMLAEQEDAWAQYMVGSMYMNGEGVRKDFKQGILWFEKAAKNGEDLAQAELGICYYLGNKGVLQNYKKAFNYTLLAAKQNHAQAQYTIGFMYMRGQGVIEDYKSGIEWLKKSAFQGNENAQHELGLCYYKGTGALQDYTEAYAWSLLAVMNGGEDTLKSVLQHKLPTEQVITAQTRAKELLKEIESTTPPSL